MSASAPDPTGSIDRELETWRRARRAHQATQDYKDTGWLPGMAPEVPAKAKAPAAKPPVEKAKKEAQGRLFDEEK